MRQIFVQAKFAQACMLSLEPQFPVIQGFCRARNVAFDSFSVACIVQHISSQALLKSLCFDIYRSRYNNSAIDRNLRGNIKKAVLESHSSLP